MVTTVSSPLNRFIRNLLQTSPRQYLIIVLYSMMTALICGRHGSNTLLLSIFVAVTPGVSWSKPLNPVKCSDRYLKFTLISCDQHLADISSAILSLLNLTEAYQNDQICGPFSKYVECVSPNVRDCPSSLLHVYHTDITIYSHPPYLCTVPSTSHLPSRQVMPSQYNSPPLRIYHPAIVDLYSSASDTNRPHLKHPLLQLLTVLSVYLLTNNR